MDIKILEQYKLVLNNKKSYILVLNALPNYRSEKVQIGNDIFDFFLVYREKIQFTIDYSISITTEKEYQFEGKNIYFIPLEDK